MAIPVTSFFLISVYLTFQLLTSSIYAFLLGGREKERERGEGEGEKEKELESQYLEILTASVTGENEEN